MATIKPFAALRFRTDKAGEIETLTCPPYDIISEEQRREYLRQNPNNIIRLELPRGEDPYAEAGRLLSRWQEEGVLKQDETPALYIYEEEFTVRAPNGGEQRKKLRGLICRVQLEAFSKGVVLPHEETLSKAKADRFELMRATFCNFSQIYSLYMDEEGRTRRSVEALSAGAPAIEMTDGDGVTHRLWVVPDSPAVQEICAQFAERKLYIADGHHRYETALNFRDWCREQGLSSSAPACDSVMMMLVDMENEGLVVFPTHRLVRGLASFDPEKVKRGCAPYFEVAERSSVEEMEAELGALYEAGKKAFGFYSGGPGWTLMTYRESAVPEALLEGSQALRGLDVSVLHTMVLERILGIDKENMAKQVNLTYTKQFEEAIAAVREGRAQCAFVLNPTRVTEIRDVATAGEKMPQKSTYFYPKLITGLVMNTLRG